MPKKKTHGGKRPGAGRPKTSAGWKSITLSVPAPVHAAWMALADAERGRAKARMTEIVEAAVKMR